MNSTEVMWRKFNLKTMTYYIHIKQKKRNYTDIIYSTESYVKGYKLFKTITKP